MKKLSGLILIVICLAGYGQDTLNRNGYNVLYYPSGKLSSEGTMKDGKPDGYWKTYFENGFLKSEGNRKNFELDSTWKFYSDSGRLVMEINYRDGKKNGIRRTYTRSEIIEENFSDNVKAGKMLKFYPDGKIKYKVEFIDGREEGLAREYAPEGTVITLTEFRKGFVINTEYINRKREGLKHGDWKEFYENEKIKSEGTYSYGKRNGYFKEYDELGNLLSIRKFVNDEFIYDAPELASYDVKTDYYRNGKPKVVQSFKEGVAEGIRREYDINGNIVKSYIFFNGIVTGEGIVDEKGRRQGAWKEFYLSGEKEAEGEYLNNLRKGPWKFYFRNGATEQSGTYNSKGKPDGVWKWFYESGNLRKLETYNNGILNGEYKELSDSGSILVKGEFIDGEEEGEWLYEVGDEKEIGIYQFGKREGEWKHYRHDLLIFKGSYIEGNPNGEFVTYWDNGKMKEKGSYIMGKKEGDWYLYDYDGTRLLVIRFEDGAEKSYDGNKIDQVIEK